MRLRNYLALALLALGMTACTTASNPEVTGMSFSSTPLTGKVIWHDLITEDSAAARVFYSGLFGWTFDEADTPDRDDYLVARLGDVYVVGIKEIAAPADGSNYSRWLPYVSVPDVDTALARSVSGGGSIAVAARDVPLGRVAAIIDPQGAVIGLATSAYGDPDDQTTKASPGRPVWTELLAADVAGAADFYAALGNYKVNTVDRRGGEYTFLANDGVDRAGVMQKPSDQIQTQWLTSFGVSDPVAAAIKAESLGGKIILPVSADVRDGTMAIVTDPTGAVLVLQQWSVVQGEG
jgi:predicted enzyme related to lactoylglutathione lyase